MPDPNDEHVLDAVRERLAAINRQIETFESMPNPGPPVQRIEDLKQERLMIRQTLQALARKPS